MPRFEHQYTDEDIKVIGLRLASAKERNLETEVVLFALKAMKEDKSLTIAQAISEGFNEWVK